jgi:F420-dependent oxidoreductase-like protein
VRIGINVSFTAGGRPQTLDELVQQVERIARGGFAFAAFANIFGVDALTTIAVAGRAVPEIELATAVVPIYTRHPVAMAQQALTTQAAIGERLTLGIGLSHERVVETVWGVPFHQPVAFMHEYLAILQPLLDRQTVAFAGKRLSAQAQLTVPEASAPSVVLAALGERMLIMAGEQTDGTALWMVGAKTLEAHVTPIITRAAQGAGRKAPRIIVGLPICVTDDVAGARARAAKNFAMYNQLPSYRAMLDREGADGPADVALIGSESDLERQLAELERAGGTEFNASVFGSSDEQERTLTFLKAQVSHARRASV